MSVGGLGVVVGDVFGGQQGIKGEVFLDQEIVTADTERKMTARSALISGECIGSGSSAGAEAGTATAGEFGAVVCAR